MSTLNEYCYELAGAGNHEAAEAIRARLLKSQAFKIASHLLENGFSVIPLCRDGKIPTRKWKPYQTELATWADLVAWFTENDYTPAIVTGRLSGITAIDCDSAEAIQEALKLGIESPVTQATKRGCHFLFPWQGERNTVKVQDIPGIDRRGEGGYIKAYEACLSWTREAISSIGFLNPNFGF
jgi:hypothetical protein